MARREYLYSEKCNHAGCKEYERYMFDTRREYDTYVAAKRTRGPYLCTRHSKPEEVLSLEQPVRTVKYTVVPDKFGEHRFGGHGAGVMQLGGGFDRYQVYAADFEPGTQVWVTIEVIRVCQVRHQLPDACCGYRSEDPGSVYQCEVIGPHEKHRIGDHTITHSLQGNGHSCEQIDLWIKLRREQQDGPGPGSEH